jgi:hypothetical protein
MREKIEELAKQAFKELHTDKEGSLLMTPVLDKFADLIINECISSIEEASKSATYTTFDQGVAGTIAARAIQAIQTKFK